MEVNPGQMNETSGEDQFDNKENIVLQSVEGDPNRYTPLADHRPPSTMFSPEKQPASMYTLETRYQPIPAKVLPKNTDPRVYYIDSKRTDEPPIINQNQPETQPVVPNVFLEPKVIAQPIFYNVAGAKTPPITANQPIPINNEQPFPTIYSITGRSRRPTVDMSVNNLEASTPVIDKSPTLYSLVGSPRPQNQFLQPTPTLYSVSGSPRIQNQVLQPSPTLYSLSGSPRLPEPSKQLVPSSANLYSIVGSPARTSRGVQVSMNEPIQPSPILYTVVGDTPVQTDRSKEKYLSTIKKQPTDAAMYKLDNEANYLKAQQQQPIPKPSVYALVDKPNSPPAKPPVRKKTPPPPQTTTITTRRVSRSLERKPEPRNEEIISYPITKPKEQKPPPKAETIFIPLDEKEQIQRKPNTIPQNQPIQLPDYRSPYANRTTKPYRERKYNNNPLPVVHSHSERKPRPPLYEPRYRVESRQPYTPAKPTSLERYPVNTKTRLSIWDNSYQAQTDDDEEYEQNINKKKRTYKTTRPRAPWIPVW